MQRCTLLCQPGWLHLLYQDMIQQLLNSLRLFSFTTRPEPPKDKK